MGFFMASSWVSAPCILRAAVSGLAEPIVEAATIGPTRWARMPVEPANHTFGSVAWWSMADTYSLCGFSSLYAAVERVGVYAGMWPPAAHC